MGLWMQEYGATALVALVLVCIVVGIVGKMIQDKKKGKGSCGCGCSGCALRDVCHKEGNAK
ncbi:MAG: FeoB-associated Cys-rich membrane protein [Clostridia bacterium]|nr:FeoB-associated Cys-rich membrane protein [Clostridia bacterium]